MKSDPSQFVPDFNGQSYEEQQNGVVDKATSDANRKAYLEKPKPRPQGFGVGIHSEQDYNMAASKGGNVRKGPSRNDERPNGKAWKKNPKVQGNKKKGTGGYSPAKLAEREAKRAK